MGENSTWESEPVTLLLLPSLLPLPPLLSNSALPQQQTRDP